MYYIIGTHQFNEKMNHWISKKRCFYSFMVGEYGHCIFNDPMLITESSAVVPRYRICRPVLYDWWM
jgi:hypothetical protein